MKDELIIKILDSLKDIQIAILELIEEIKSKL